MTLASPSEPPVDDPNWERYPNRSGEILFHCGFTCYLEVRSEEELGSTQCVNDPIGEACYDENNQLVDDTHPRSGCKGTPDYWPASHWPVEHTLFDKGGIRGSGLEGFKESNRKRNDATWQRQQFPFCGPM